jgi:hypothetical protein
MAFTPTGRWWGEVDLRARGGPRRKRAFLTKRDAERYERYVRDHDGEEPPEFLADGNKVAREGRSFREIAERCKERGGGIVQASRRRSCHAMCLT